LSSTYLSAAGKVSPSKAMQHIHVKDSLDSSSQKLLDSSSMACTIPQSWTAPAALHLACSTLSHSSSCTFSSQLDNSFSSPPRLLQQPAAAGQLLQLLQLLAAPARGRTSAGQ